MIGRKGKIWLVNGDKIIVGYDEYVLVCYSIEW